MEPAKREDYIFAQKERRERTTVNRFFASPESGLRSYFEHPFGWALPQVWLGLRLPHERLLHGFKRPPKKFLGDVDVCGGSLLMPVSQEEYDRYYLEEDRLIRAESPEKYRDVSPPPLAIHNLVSMALLAQGRIKWPPDLGYIAAAEVKVSHYNAENVLKATGSGSRKPRTQAEELCKMGFDRVGLIRFLVTEPVISDKHHPWMLAGARSGDAMDEYLDKSNKRNLFDEKDPFGTILISIGSVPGKLEHMAGSTSGKWLHQAPENPYKEQASDVRKALEDTLGEVMSRYPVPTSVPMLILACSDNTCANIYVGGGDPDTPCPNCGKRPR
jgi:hypothetical protein